MNESTASFYWTNTKHPCTPWESITSMQPMCLHINYTECQHLSFTWIGGLIGEPFKTVLHHFMSEGGIIEDLTSTYYISYTIITVFHQIVN